MQERGYTPTIVENVIKFGVKTLGNKPNTFVYSDVVNKIRVVVNATTGRIITVI